MRVIKTHASIIISAIEYWSKEGLIDSNTKDLLSKSVEVIPFDWKKLSKYSFWIAIICIIIAVSAIFADKILLELLKFIFKAPYIVKFCGLSILSASIFWYGIKRRMKNPSKIFSNEAVMFLGVLTTAGAVYQLGNLLSLTSGHISLLLLFSFLIYGLLGFFIQSNLIWLFSLLSLGSWMGAETGYVSGWGAYYLGMNYPIRFVLFGIFLSCMTFILKKYKPFQPLINTTLIISLFYMFTSLWIMSIIGNYGDMTVWRATRPIELLHWSLLFGMFAGGAIYHGLRFDNGITKGFGITFVFINLYTRYFEYFWNTTHKAIFFLILGISFWVLGLKAEKIWFLGKEIKK